LARAIDGGGRTGHGDHGKESFSDGSGKTGTGRGLERMYSRSTRTGKLGGARGTERKGPIAEMRKTGADNWYGEGSRADSDVHLQKPALREQRLAKSAGRRSRMVAHAAPRRSAVEADGESEIQLRARFDSRQPPLPLASAATASKSSEPMMATVISMKGSSLSDYLFGKTCSSCSSCWSHAEQRYRTM
jgi:hypothetical protein